MEYKVGDKLLCKSIFNGYYDNLDIKIGDYYIVEKVREKRGDIMIKNIKDNDMTFIRMINLQYYFYTKQEERKLKLDEIKSR